ncbi:PH domain-containing protein [Paraoerskovia marina]|uniref:PH domain-containing protein n=1 Tax=Paraoerskovia marina TaxID=545619 RepID=UPI0005B9F2C8|nr:PH domain-containing protein [Paraoerskovia marina]
MSEENLRWRRVHPVTPLVRGWGIFLAALVVVANTQIDNIGAGGGIPGFGDLLWSIVGLVVVLVLGIGFAALSWRYMKYAIGEDTVQVNSGILFRQQRRARLDRLQAVDVVQPLLGRIFGLAELKLEVAGGADSGIKLGMLSLSETEALRNELLERAAGVRQAKRAETAGQEPGASDALPTGTTGTAATEDGEGHGEGLGTVEVDEAGVPGVPVRASAGAPADADVVLEATAAPERPVFDVPAGRLVGSILLSWELLAFVVAVLALAGVVAGTREPFLLFVVLPGLLGFGAFAVSRFTREFGFAAGISPDGIRLRSGLLETRRQTIPPGRVQAVVVHQPLLWRRRDWWRVEVNVAGYGGSKESAAESVLLPVGTRADALLAVWLVLPDFGTDDPVAVLTEGLVGVGPSERTTVSPRRARWVDPWSWRRNGWSVTDRALLLRSGYFHRTLDVVPHERTQSLGLQQGPLQRRLGVVTFAVHSTPGPVSPGCPHLDESDAVALTVAQAARAHEAREHATPEQWMRTVSEGVL